jgi:hypothetical protein
VRWSRRSRSRRRVRDCRAFENQARFHSSMKGLARHPTRGASLFIQSASDGMSAARVRLSDPTCP